LKCGRENSDKGLKRRRVDSGKYKEGTIVELFTEKGPEREFDYLSPGPLVSQRRVIIMQSDCCILF